LAQRIVCEKFASRLALAEFLTRLWAVNIWVVKNIITREIKAIVKAI